MPRSRSVALAICLLGSSMLPIPARALDVDEVFIGVVEDREVDTDLIYVFVLSLAGDDIAGGRVFKPGNPIPICELELDATFLGFDATCNIGGTSVADLCSQFGFGDFIVSSTLRLGPTTP